MTGGNVETPEKPLHVRVAEALGWKKPSEQDPPRCDVCGWPIVPREDNGCWPDSCSLRPVPDGRADEPARYDTDWSATGPLIEKYGIMLEVVSGRSIGKPEEDAWEASLNIHRPRIENYDGEAAYGATPLVAVCHLILALKEAGKL